MSIADRGAAVEAFGRLLVNAHRMRSEAAQRAEWLAEREATAKRFAPFSTDEIKSMWDRLPDDGSFMVDGFWGEEIHAELNSRGHGGYCAV